MIKKSYFTNKKCLEITSFRAAGLTDDFFCKIIVKLFFYGKFTCNFVREKKQISTEIDDDLINFS